MHRLNGLKPNRQAIENAVGDIFLEKAFEAAIQTIAANAFPGIDTLRQSNGIHKFMKFTHNALEAAGGYQALLNAIDTEKDPAKLHFLTELNYICVDTALEASTRFAMEAAEDEIEEAVDEGEDPIEGIENDGDPNIDDELNEEGELEEPPAEEPAKKILPGKDLQTLALDTPLNEKELKKLGSNLRTLDTPKIAKIVNDKIVDAIETEKKAYQEIDEANDRLKAALTEKEELYNKSEQEALDSVNRVLGITLGEGTPRDHVSLFSTLQVNSATALLSATEGVENASIDKVATRVLCRTIPEKFKENTSLSASIEEAIGAQLATANPAMADAAGKEKLLKLSTFISTMVLTVIETLYTLNLHKYTCQDIEGIVKTKGFDNCMTKSITANVNQAACDAIEQCKKHVNGTKDVGALESALESVIKLHDKIVDIERKGVAINKETKEAIESVQTAIVERTHKLSAEFDAATEGCSYAASLRNELGMKNDIVAMEHFGALINRKKPNKLICTLSEEGAMEATFMRDNNPYFTNSIALEGSFEAIGVENYVNMLMKKAGVDKITYSNDRKPEFKIIVR